MMGQIGRKMDKQGDIGIDREIDGGIDSEIDGWLWMDR